MEAGAFNASCLSVVDQVQRKCEPVLITRRGKPVAKLVPANVADADAIFGFYAGQGRIVGEIVAPVLPHEDWGR